jgi:glycine C-acetyltransferase
MYGKIKEHLQNELQTIEDNGFSKERIITSPQGAEITISTGETVLNFVPIIIWDYHLIQK